METEEGELAAAEDMVVRETSLAATTKIRGRSWKLSAWNWTGSTNGDMY